MLLGSYSSSLVEGVNGSGGSVACRASERRALRMLDDVDWLAGGVAPVGSGACLRSGLGGLKASGCWDEYFFFFFAGSDGADEVAGGLGMDGALSSAGGSSSSSPSVDAGVAFLFFFFSPWGSGSGR